MAPGNNSRQTVIDYAKRVATALARVVLVLTFLCSGFLKAADPKGTAYKLEEYADYFAPSLSSLFASHSSFLITAAIVLAAVEFMIGLLLLFGLRRRLTSICVLALVSFLTLLTLYIAIYNPVEDCGCFGEALHLSNWQTFGKNIVLFCCALCLYVRRKHLLSLHSSSYRFLIAVIAMVCFIAFALYSAYFLPLLDFRPYSIGTNLQSRVFPEESDEETLYDFYLSTPEGQDATADVLFADRPVFLLISPYLEQANPGMVDELLGLLDFARTNDYLFYAVTASTPSQINEWQQRMGDNFPYLRADATLLKTIVRSNPGLVLLNQGIVLNKWSCHNLPDLQEYSQTTISQLSRSKQ